MAEVYDAAKLSALRAKLQSASETSPSLAPHIVTSLLLQSDNAIEQLMRARDSARDGAFSEMIAWHQEQIEHLEREIEHGRQWSIENNDGRPDLAGTYYTVDCPQKIQFHREMIEEIRRLKTL